MASQESDTHKAPDAVNNPTPSLPPTDTNANTDTITSTTSSPPPPNKDVSSTADSVKPERNSAETPTSPPSTTPSTLTTMTTTTRSGNIKSTEAPSSFTQAHHQPSGSKSRSRPQSILRRSTDPPIPFFEVTPAVAISSPTSDEDSVSPSPSSPPSSLASPQLQHATSTQSLKVSRSARSSTASSEDSSLISDSTLASGSATTTTSSSSSSSSSTRTRATTLCSTPSSLNVSFAPLPKIEPRKRNSNRPIGLAARGMMLRQRRLIALQQAEGYYECDMDPMNTIPGGQQQLVQLDSAGFEIHVSKKSKSPKSERSEGDDVEDPIVAIGKAVSGATKGLWRRISSPKLNDHNSNNSNASQKGSNTKRNLGWPLRRRRTESEAVPEVVVEESSDDDVEGPWSRRRNEDPMTKTIMEASEEEAGIAIPRYILSYDAVLGRDELGGEFTDDEDDGTGGTALSRAHSDIHTTVEVHVVKSASDDGEQDEKQQVEVAISVSC